MIKHNLHFGHIKYCQICASEELELIIDLGHHAPCDSLLNEKQLSQMEKLYPLRLLRCIKCGLVQIDYVVPPEELFFPDYPYRSGITETLSRNLQSTAVALVKEYDLDVGSLAVDIGSNDGTLLQGFKSQGMNVLGIEPTNIAEFAIQNGIPTIQEFFSETLVEKIKREYGQAAVITAANMFAHVSELGDLIQGCSELLADGGIFVTESHYLLDMIQTVQYDAIYHEHLKYYSLKSLMVLMGEYDFTIIDVERISNYGGSIRVIAKKGKGHIASVRLHELLREEEHAKLDDAQTYGDFREKIVRSKMELQNLLVDLRRKKQQVVGIGCPGRASTLLNYCNIDSDFLPYIAEQASSLKLGLYLPGKHIPIVDEKIMFEENPEYALLLSWHYAMPIIKKLRAKGLESKIIVPLPKVQIIED
jgi:SAM-dependent methyltransferase